MPRQKAVQQHSGDWTMTGKVPVARVEATASAARQERHAEIDCAGLPDIADLLRREGVIDEHSAIFVGGVVALKALKELKSGEYIFPKRASVRDVQDFFAQFYVASNASLVRPCSERITPFRNRPRSSAGLATIWRAINRRDLTLKKNGTRRRTASA